MSNRAEPLVAGTRADTPTPESVDEDERISVLLYGVSGVGKTAFASTAADDPRTAPVLYLDFENGSKTIKWRTRNIWVMKPEQIGDRLLTILADVRAGRAIHKESGKPFRSVVFDSITEAGSSVEEALRSRDAGRPRGAVEGKLERDEWPEYTNLMRDILRNWRLTPVSLIAIATEAQETDAKGNLKRYLPDILGGRVRNNLGQYFDTVGRLYIKREGDPDGGGVTYVRRLDLRDDGRTTAKDRDDPFGLLPPFMANPTITQLLNRCSEGMALARAHAYKD